jgi:hypothetical protein
VEDIEKLKSIEIIAVVVIVVLAIAGAFFLNNRPSNVHTALTSASTTVLVTTTAAANSTPASYNITYNCFGANSTALCHGGGPGKYYISAVQAAQLIGGGGSYLVIYKPDGFNYSYFTNNVTANWYQDYTVSQPHITKIVFEFVYLSPKAQYLYKMQNAQDLQYAMNKSNQQTIVAVNATIDGMTYTYLRYLGSTSRSSFLIGYKNDTMVEATAPYEVNQTAFASIVAEDIPK